MSHVVMNWGQRFQVEGTARVETESGDLLGIVSWRLMLREGVTRWEMRPAAESREVAGPVGERACSSLQVV